MNDYCNDCNAPMVWCVCSPNLRKFIGDDNGDLFCAVCKRKGEWQDCPIHPDDHFSVYCFKCGIENMDCEDYMVVSQ